MGDKDAPSCIETGSHHWLLPTAGPKTTSKMISGTCKKCGLVKRFPSQWEDKKKEEVPSPGKTESIRFDVHVVRKVTDHEEQDWDLGFDSLVHASSGPIGHLEHVALQLEPTTLFADRYLRSLEVLGHIDVERDPRTFEPVRWEMAPTTLAELADGSWFLVGARSADQLDALRRLAAKRGGTVVTASEPGALARVVVAGIDADTARSLNDDLTSRDLGGFEVQPSAASSMVGALPPLSDLINQLPSTTAVGARSINRWDTTTATWERVPDAEAAGYYQMFGSRMIYAMRTQRDVAEGRMTRVDARIVKHAAALEGGQELIGYDASTCTLFAPIGADIPGLYGRSAVLASGLAPIDDRANGVVRYGGVTPQIAGAIIASLTR